VRHARELRSADERQARLLDEIARLAETTAQTLAQNKTLLQVVMSSRQELQNLAPTLRSLDSAVTSYATMSTVAQPSAGRAVVSRPIAGGLLIEGFPPNVVISPDRLGELRAFAEQQESAAKDQLERVRAAVRPMELEASAALKKAVERLDTRPVDTKRVT